MKEKEDELRNRQGGIGWAKLASLLGDKEGRLRNSFYATWKDSGRRKKCGECV